MFHHSRLLDRVSSGIMCVALAILAADTGRLAALGSGVWAAMYATAALFYAARVFLRDPPSWLRALSLSSLIVVSSLRAAVLWSVDGRTGPAGLALIVVVLALRDPSPHARTVVRRNE